MNLGQLVNRYLKDSYSCMLEIMGVFTRQQLKEPQNNNQW